MPALALSIKDIDQLDHIIKRGRPLKKGEHLFLEGDPFASVFAVRSGAIKTYTATNEGEEQITSFYLPSEILGLSGWIPIPIRYLRRLWKPPWYAKFH